MTDDLRKLQQNTSSDNNKIAHSGARFDVRCKQVPNIHPLWENSKGVPLSAIVFGCRRSDGLPLVVESLSWKHGGFMAVSLRSESTNKDRVLTNDPMGMRPIKRKLVGLRTKKAERAAKNRKRRATDPVPVKEKKPKKESRKSTATLDLTELSGETLNIIRGLELKEDKVLVNRFGIQLRQRDLDKLEPGQCLNDDIINYYLQLVAERSSGKAFALSSLLYTQLADKGTSSVTKWTKDVDLFSFDVLLLPIHLPGHWTLAVVLNKHKRIDYYDSMGGNGAKHMEQDILAQIDQTHKAQPQSYQFSISLVTSAASRRLWSGGDSPRRALHMGPILDSSASNMGDTKLRNSFDAISLGEADNNCETEAMDHRFRNHFPPIFKPKKVVVVSKSSMLEYELARFESRSKKACSGIEDQRFLKELIKRHANIEELKRRHTQQSAYVKAICDELRSHDIEFRVVNRHNYTHDLVDWSDLVISAGGDGTFLTAAKKVRTVPVIGINTDPVGSEFLNNEFKWAHRQRIRVTIVKPSDSNPASPASSSTSSSSSSSPVDNHEDVGEQEQANTAREFKFSSDDEYSDADVNIEPRLALNEVFMGESHAARVSYYEVQLDDGPLMKQKSSGLTICTGTGSTSWHYNINRLTEQNLKEVLEVINHMGFDLDREVDNHVIEEICKRYNQKLVFEPEAQKMAFSIRDPVFNATFPKTASRGFANKIRLKSSGRGAGRVVLLDEVHSEWQGQQNRYWEGH
uniref:NAD(+) kinase n=1 Tax=Ditylenchus dipsaci TaxID=166011 RepID=A0A915D3F9_9BILA